jgi:ribose transport system substrate-binding protein
MAATVAQQPEEIGRLGVETAKKLIDKQPVEKSIAVPLKLLTKE